MKILGRLIVVSALVLLAVAAAPTLANAVPTTTTTFTFTGKCDDCAGAITTAPFHALADGIYQDVTGTLVLDNFQPGVPLTTANFGSFSYGGSNILKPFNVTSATTLTGTLNAQGSLVSLLGFELIWAQPSLATTVPGVNIPCGGSCDFFIGSDHSFWSIGGVPVDQGINAAFAPAVPEPSSLALLVVGLVGLLALMRARAPAR
jgi:hypothetical protein